MGGGRDAAGSRPVVEFPTRERMSAVLDLGEPPDVANLVIEQAVHVDRWEIQATPAPGDLVYAAEGGVEALLDEAAAERGVTLTRSGSLRCVAQETARFFIEHDAWPTEQMTTFLLAACGSSLTDVRQAATRGTNDPRASEAQLLEEAGSHMREAIAPALADGRLAGIALARRAEDVAMVVVTGQPLMRVEPPEPPGADGLAIVRGVLEAGDAHAVVAVVNQGALGAARCYVTPGFELPVVELRCPMREEDATALVHVRTTTLGRVLSRHVASVLLRRTPDAVPVFDASPLGAAGPITDPAAVGPLLVERVNAIRAQAALAPLALATRQSAVHATAAPHMLGSTDRDTLDVLGLGLLAGWAVDGGVIRWGDIVGSVSRGGVDVGRWLSAAMAAPSARFVLLQPDARQLAAGAVLVPERDAIGIVASTYTFYEGVDHTATAHGFFERIVEARRHRSLPPPRRLDLPRLAAHAAAVAEGREDVQSALQAALNEESTHLGRSLRGLVVESVDLEAMPLPEALFERRDFALGVAVGHTRAPGAAWGQWVVFLTFG